MLYGRTFHVHTTYVKVVYTFYGHNVFVHTTYGKIIYMLYGQVVYICNIEKYMSYDTEQVHNESIVKTYLKKRYTNIAPTGHNI